MVGERRARVLAQARHDVERAFGKARLDREFGQTQRHQARLLGGLDDAGVADRERGADAAAENLAGIVPRDDMRGDALGLPDRGDEEAVEERDRVAVQLVGGGAVELEIARDRHRVGAGLFERLAGVAGLQQRQLLDVVLDQPPELAEQPPALGRGQAAPGAALEGAARGGDR